MSRYELFQKWWTKTTSVPSDFNINKRSAEIGFYGALDTVKWNEISIKIDDLFIQWSKEAEKSIEEVIGVYKFVTWCQKEIQKKA